MESPHLSGEENVPASHDESSLQVSGGTSLLSQNSDEFLAEEKDAPVSDGDASVSDGDASVEDFGEKDDISNYEDCLQIEDVDALEAKNENQNNHELCIGMDFSSDESAYKAYRKYGSSHGFDDTSLPPDTQLSVVSATSLISYNEPSFSQLLEEFDKNRDGSS
ncbi:hypothetical protein Rs2_02959 [Raphanus sativus]|nr:hypothetical protein Rs2_02959 [Raphanus sativus]